MLLDDQMKIWLPVEAQGNVRGLRVQRLANPLLPVPCDWAAVGPVYCISFDGIARLAQPGELTLAYDDMALIGRSSLKLGIYWNDPVRAGQWAYVGGVVDEHNATIAVPIWRPGSYSIFMADKRFNDLDGHWAKEDIELLASRHLVCGTGGGRFEPDRSITRAEFTQLVVRLAQAVNKERGTAEWRLPIAYNDVSDNAWYAEAVKQASLLGIIQGVNGKFLPNAAVAKDEAVVIAARALGASASSKPDAARLMRQFGNSVSVADWRRGQAANLHKGSQLDGGPAVGKMGDKSGGILKPSIVMTRAEAASLMLRALDFRGSVRTDARQMLTGMLKNVDRSEN